MNAREGFRRFFRVLAYLIAVPAFAFYTLAYWPSEIDARYWAAVLHESEQLDFDPSRTFQVLREQSISAEANLGLSCAKAAGQASAKNVKATCDAIAEARAERGRDIALHFALALVIGVVIIFIVLAAGRIFDWVLAGFQGAA